MNEVLRITPREAEIIRRLADGQSYKVMAYEMGLRHGSIQWSARGLMDLVGIRTAAGLVAFGFRAGWIK
jgi:DNA-binding NarL/FixJ family response regulator